jgi:hypothetical protein
MKDAVRIAHGVGNKKRIEIVTEATKLKIKILNPGKIEAKKLPEKVETKPKKEAEAKVETKPKKEAEAKVETKPKKEAEAKVETKPKKEAEAKGKKEVRGKSSRKKVAKS